MKSLIYIERNNLYYYGGNVHAPIAFPFQPAVIRDIEVINPEELTKQLNDFIKTNKIEPIEVLIVVAHQSSFEKSLPPKTDPAVIESEKKKFLENVPFSKILSKIFTNEKGTKIIAANKELVYIIRDIFNKHEFTVEGIASVIPIYPDNDVALTADSAQQILKKGALLKQNGFPIVDIEAEITDTFDDGFVHEKKNMNLYLMLGVLVLGIGILAFMLWNRQQVSKKSSSDLATPTPQTSARQAAISPTTVPTVSTASPSADIIAKDTFTIQILNGSGIAGQADDINEILEEAGYANISTGNTQTVQSPNSLIIFRNQVPQSVRNEVSELVKEVAGNVATQTNEDLEVDILITTSRGT